MFLRGVTCTLVSHNVACFDMVRGGVTLCDVVLHGVAWCEIVRFDIRLNCLANMKLGNTITNGHPHADSH